MGPVLLFDGFCGFCDATVQWIMRHDSSGVFRMAPLQGETALAILARHPEVPENLDSLIVVEIQDGEEVLHWESRAISRGARYLPLPWRLLALVALVPCFLADPMYRWVARHRMRILGKNQTCRVPTPEDNGRMLP